MKHAMYIDTSEFLYVSQHRGWKYIVTNIGGKTG